MATQLTWSGEDVRLGDVDRELAQLRGEAAQDRPSFPNYAAGTWGPPSADDLLKRAGRSWRRH